MLDIGADEAVELDHRAGGAQAGGLAAARRDDLGCGPLDLGGGHLAGDGALPDQVVEPRLVAVEEALDVLRRTAELGRADRLVGLLGVLRLGGVEARLVRDVPRAEGRLDRLTRRLDRLGSDLHAVGTHVGDQADGLAADIDAFIEPLRDLHRAGGREAELGGGRLLQRRGGEGRTRVAAGGLRLDAVDAIGRAFQHRAHQRRPRLVADRHLLQLVAVERGQPGAELVAARRREQGAQLPVFLRLEDLDLRLAIADEAQRHGLDAAGRAGARQLAPQHRGEGEADQIVEGAAGEIGVDQRLVDLPRVRHRVQHRLLRDGVEDDAAHRLGADHLLLAQHLEHVPRDRLALPVRIGGEDDAVGLLHRLGDLVQPLLGKLGHLPVHGEVLVRPDGAVLGRQIAHVSVGSENLEVAAEILVDRLRFGRRFDDDDIHEKTVPRAEEATRDSELSCRMRRGVRRPVTWTVAAAGSTPPPPPPESGCNL